MQRRQNLIEMTYVLIIFEEKIIFSCFQLKELIELADRFFAVFDRCGPMLREIYMSTMRRQKNGRQIDEFIK